VDILSVNLGLDLRTVLNSFEIVMRQVAVGRDVSMGTDDLAGEFQRSASSTDGS